MYFCKKFMEDTLTYISLEAFNYFLIGMSVAAVIVFIALNFVDAGYGMFANKKWGLMINNKIAWFFMEVPVFLSMLMLWIFSERHWQPVLFTFFIFFQFHYFRRAFLFPFMLKGESKMPLSIMFMGITFNLCNAFMQGGWLFYVSPEDYYPLTWFYSPQFIIGTIIYFSGMYINISSDRIIRSLRKPGDTKYYLPTGGLFNYVSSAHYFGETIQWIGFAILTWSISGAVFALWTFANLVPRANAVYHKYQAMFGEEIKNKKLKRIFPFIY